MQILNTEAVQLLDVLYTQSLEKNLDMLDPVFKVKLQFTPNSLMADYYEPLESRLA